MSRANEVIEWTVDSLNVPCAACLHSPDTGLAGDQFYQLEMETGSRDGVIFAC
jgi:hypothetical protein